MNGQDEILVTAGPEARARLAQAVMHLAEEARSSGLQIAAALLGGVRDALLTARAPDKPAA